MKNHRIEIFRQVPAPVDSELDAAYEQVCSLWAERTESGGRENLYASRMVSENEVIYSIRWRSGILSGMLVKDHGELRKVLATQEEGFRSVLHIKVNKDDTGDLNGY